MDAWTVGFSPDSRFLASGSHHGKINLFGVDSGRKESSLDTRGKLTLSIAYVSTWCKVVYEVIPTNPTAPLMAPAVYLSKNFTLIA